MLDLGRDGPTSYVQVGLESSYSDVPDVPVQFDSACPGCVAIDMGVLDRGDHGERVYMRMSNSVTPCLVPS